MIKPKKLSFPHFVWKLSEFYELLLDLPAWIGRLPISSQRFWTLGFGGRMCIHASGRMVLFGQVRRKALSAERIR